MGPRRRRAEPRAARRNYGWPLASYGCPYTFAQSDAACRPAAAPTRRTTRSRRPPGCRSRPPLPGLAFYNGDKFPEWSGNLFAGALAGATLWRFVLDANDGVTLREEVAVVKALGKRIRACQAGAGRLALPAQRRRLADPPRALNRRALGRRALRDAPSRPARASCRARPGARGSSPACRSCVQFDHRGIGQLRRAALHRRGP